MQIAGQPVASLTLPPFPPQNVARAYETFDSIADEYGELLGEIADHEELARVDLARASREAAEARVSGGKPPRDPAAVEAKHTAKAAELASRLTVLRIAVHTAGNDLADAVDAAREDWISAIEAERDKARQRLSKSLAGVRKAIEDLRPLGGAEEYLAEFDPVMAHAGRQPGFPGGRCTVDAAETARFLDSYTEPSKLIDLLEELVNPTPKFVGTTNGRPVYTSTLRGRLVRHFEDGELEVSA
ncbi:MAG: hypothetical protein ACJ752_14080 [Gaiellaceae bacterium]